MKIVGRSKDMIIRGGENVYPREIEEFLYTHDAISDAAVYGVPDPRYGEAVMVSVILREGASLTEDELRDVLLRQDRPLQGAEVRHLRRRASR